MRLESHQACHVGTSYVRSDFYEIKNQSPRFTAPPFRKKPRSAHYEAADPSDMLDLIACGAHIVFLVTGRGQW